MMKKSTLTDCYKSLLFKNLFMTLPLSRSSYLGIERLEVLMQ